MTLALFSLHCIACYFQNHFSSICKVIFSNSSKNITVILPIKQLKAIDLLQYHLHFPNINYAKPWVCVVSPSSRASSIMLHHNFMFCCRCLSSLWRHLFLVIICHFWSCCERLSFPIFFASGYRKELHVSYIWPNCV